MLPEDKVSGLAMQGKPVALSRGATIPMAIHHMKPKTIFEDGGSVKGPRPKGDLRPVEINHQMYLTCIVRQE